MALANLHYKMSLIAIIIIIIIITSGGDVACVLGDGLHPRGVSQDRRDRHAQGELHGGRLHTGAMERTGARRSGLAGRRRIVANQCIGVSAAIGVLDIGNQLVANTTSECVAYHRRRLFFFFLGQKTNSLRPLLFPPLLSPRLISPLLLLFPCLSSSLLSFPTSPPFRRRPLNTSRGPVGAL